MIIGRHCFLFENNSDKLGFQGGATKSNKLQFPAEGTMDSRRNGCPWNVLNSKLKFFRRVLRLIRRKKSTTGREDPQKDPKDGLPIQFDQNGESAEGNSWSAPLDSMGISRPDVGQVEPGRIDAEESKSREWELRQAVKHIHFGCAESKGKAASQIQKMAGSNAKMRKSLAQLGVIPPLVALLDSPVREHQLSALQALSHLSKGDYTNKALVVKAGAVAKLGRLLGTSDLEMQEHIAVALLAISAMEKSRSMLGSSEALPSLVSMLESGTAEGRMASLGVLYNVSTLLENVDIIVKVGAIQPLLKMVESVETAETSLSILGNLMATGLGRKSMESVMKMPKCLIDRLGSENSSKCQERAAYILMVLAHRSSTLRQAMMQAGIIPVLLEMTLAGTALAQKRATRILQCLRCDKETAIMVVSGPLDGRVCDGSGLGYQDNMNSTEMEGHRRAVKSMVERSLNINMEHIMKRANLSSLSLSSSARFRPLRNSSSCKDLS